MSNREKVYTYVLAVLIGLMVALLLLAVSNYGAYAEAGPTIVYTYYNGAEIYGLADTLVGEYWARIGLHTEEQCTHIFAAITQTGEFHATLNPCDYVTVEIVTEPYAEAVACLCYWPELVW